MQFTGKNLEIIRSALRLAQEAIDMEIGQCNNVFEYADELEALEYRKAGLAKLAARIDARMLEDNIGR